VRVAVLTTDTTHHAYYVWQLAERGLLAGVVLETRTHDPGFETHHPFEDERDAYERDVLLAGAPREIDGYAPTHVADSVNDASALAAVSEMAPDLLVSFGTGLIDARLIAGAPAPLVNLHGGDPEEYRGLDTHLWAIYHRDFGALVTTLHAVDAGLDTGAIVGQEPIAHRPSAPLHELRAANTQTCVDLTVAAAAATEALGRVPLRPQRRRGRYYSSMPAVLKPVCVRRYADYTAAL
jgi:folate-dependent phosphoribosylglycinamide formyltransferase PurN